jgi:aminocarboxymuconate-semialdehyde decarboxylase
VIVDAHNHVFPETVISLLGEEPGYGVQISGRTVSSGSHANHELFPALYDPRAKLAELDAMGLGGAVLSLAPRLFSYQASAELGERLAEAANRGLREFAEADPARLRWMGQLPLQDPERAAALVPELRAAGAVGVEVGSAIADRRLDEAAYEPFWTAVEDAGLVVFVHPAHIPRVPGTDDFHLRNVIGNPLETTICAERLLSTGVLDRHPRVRIILAHGGGYFPYQAGRWQHARKVRAELADAPEDPWAAVGRLLFDTITHDPRALAYMIDRVGAENVVVGTDNPYDMGTTDPLGELRAAVDAATAKQIAEDNPARLFGF